MSTTFKNWFKEHKIIILKFYKCFSDEFYEFFDKTGEPLSIRVSILYFARMLYNKRFF